ncbi:hypothetical protein CJF32_00004812 [Rutstroemia sp. NJR-2017a WRK4]|nr:hypothetical protein CJF32_00004812 [Rutstroemia sp. NJR-2017a WRK4]
MGAKQSSLSSEAVGTSKKPLSDASILNQFNAGKEELPGKSDVVVIGGGIHALIYAIHAKTLELSGSCPDYHLCGDNDMQN